MPIYHAVTKNISESTCGKSNCKSENVNTCSECTLQKTKGCSALLFWAGKNAAGDFLSLIFVESYLHTFKKLKRKL